MVAEQEVVDPAEHEHVGTDSDPQSGQSSRTRSSPWEARRRVHRGTKEPKTSITAAAGRSTRARRRPALAATAAAAAQVVASQTSSGHRPNRPGTRRRRPDRPDPAPPARRGACPSGSRYAIRTSHRNMNTQLPTAGRPPSPADWCSRIEGRPRKPMVNAVRDEEPADPALARPRRARRGRRQRNSPANRATNGCMVHSVRRAVSASARPGTVPGRVGTHGSCARGAGRGTVWVPAGAGV